MNAGGLGAGAILIVAHMGPSFDMKWSSATSMLPSSPEPPPPSAHGDRSMKGSPTSISIP
jgi:hypothetical protein